MALIKWIYNIGSIEDPCHMSLGYILKGQISRGHIRHRHNEADQACGNAHSVAMH